MDFISILIVMVRRWFVVLPVLLVTLIVGLAFIGNPEDRYVSSGTELLRFRSELDAGSVASQEIDSSLAAAVLASALVQPEVKNELAERELDGSVTAAVDPSGSIVTLTVVSDTREDAVQTAVALLDLAPALLDEILGADVTASVELNRLGTPTEAGETDGGYFVSAYMTVLPAIGSSSAFPPSNGTAQLLVELAKRNELKEAVAEAVPGGEFAVAANFRGAAPLLVIDVIGGEPDEIPTIYGVVVEQLEQELVRLQATAGVLPADQTILYPLVEPTLVERASASVVRAAAGIALVGLAAAAGAAILMDSEIRRRRERNASRPTNHSELQELDDAPAANP